jgi:hypothetical protein
MLREPLAKVSVRLILWKWRRKSWKIELPHAISRRNLADERHSRYPWGSANPFGRAYDLQDGFEEYLNTDHRAFLAMLRVVEEYLPPLERTGSGMG